MAKKIEEKKKVILGADAGASHYGLDSVSGFVSIPAHVAPDGVRETVKLDGLGRMKRPRVIELPNGRRFYVGDEANAYSRPIENLNLDRQSGTPEIRAVFYSAFTEYQIQHGNFRAPILIGVGLPNQYLSGAEAEKRKSAVRSWTEGKHEWKADGLPYSMDVEESHPTGQIVGAIFDHLLDGEGLFIDSRKHLLKEGILAVSIGYSTIELIGVQNKNQLPRFTDGKPLGARVMLERLRREGADLASLEIALRNGSLKLGGELETWASEVTGYIDTAWGNGWKAFNEVVLVGGGVEKELLRDRMIAFFEGRARICEDPTRSVARGIRKLLTQKLNAKKD